MYSLLSAPFLRYGAAIGLMKLNHGDTEYFCVSIVSDRLGRAYMEKWLRGKEIEAGEILT